MKPTKSGRKSQVKLTVHPHLLARAEAIADERKLSLSELVEDLLRLELATPISRSLYAPMPDSGALAAHVEQRAAAAAGSKQAARRPSGASKE